jgi:hypothetical protein
VLRVFLVVVVGLGVFVLAFGLVGVVLGF